MKICPRCSKRCKSLKRFCLHYVERHGDPNAVIMGDRHYDYFGLKSMPITCHCTLKFNHFSNFVAHVRALGDFFDHFGGPDLLLDKLGRLDRDKGKK